MWGVHAGSLATSLPNEDGSFVTPASGKALELAGKKDLLARHMYGWRSLRFQFRLTLLPSATLAISPSL